MQATLGFTRLMVERRKGHLSAYLSKKPRMLKVSTRTELEGGGGGRDVDLDLDFFFCEEEREGLFLDLSGDLVGVGRPVEFERDRERGGIVLGGYLKKLEDPHGDLPDNFALKTTLTCINNATFIISCFYQFSYSTSFNNSTVPSKDQLFLDY